MLYVNYTSIEKETEHTCALGGPLMFPLSRSSYFLTSLSLLGTDCLGPPQMPMLTLESSTGGYVEAVPLGGE